MNPQSARYNCSIDAAMSVIEGRWKGTIICMLANDGTLRFSELQRKIGEITSRILSKQLKELEAEINSAQTRVCQLEYDYFCRLRASVAERMGRIQRSADTTAEAA